MAKTIRTCSVFMVGLPTTRVSVTSRPLRENESPDPALAARVLVAGMVTDVAPGDAQAGRLSAAAPQALQSRLRCRRPMTRSAKRHRQLRAMEKLADALGNVDLK